MDGTDESIETRQNCSEEKPPLRGQQKTTGQKCNDETEACLVLDDRTGEPNREAGGVEGYMRGVGVLSMHGTHHAAPSLARSNDEQHPTHARTQ
jgi:hypothetical protein